MHFITCLLYTVKHEDYHATCVLYHDDPYQNASRQRDRVIIMFNYTNMKLDRCMAGFVQMQ